MSDDNQANDLALIAEPTPRAELKDEIERHAKGADVFRFGNGLAFVPRWDGTVECGPSAIIEDHGWAVGGIYPNFDDEEFGVFIFPITTFLDGNGDR